MTATPLPNLPQGTRYRSYPWALLGTLFRNARLSGNEALASELKQVIEWKQAARKEGKKRR